MCVCVRAGQIIVGVSVYDTVPLSLTDNDIVFSDPSGLFRTDIQGNNILIEVARPLLVGVSSPSLFLYHYVDSYVPTPDLFIR